MAGLTHDSTLRELRTAQGVLRYHEAGDGPPLLMLHGSGPGVTGWRNFRGNLPAFAEWFHCMVLEFPGFGVSDPTDRHPMVAAPEAVFAFLDGLGLEQVDIIGNSMGGIVAAQVAAAQPERVRRLVTIGGVGRNLFSPGPSEGIRLLVEFTEDPTRERLVQWLNSMVHDPALVTEELIEERWNQATDPATLASARRMYGRGILNARPQGDTPPYWAMLHKIKARTTLSQASFCSIITQCPQSGKTCSSAWGMVRIGTIAMSSGLTRSSRPQVRRVRAVILCNIAQ